MRRRRLGAVREELRGRQGEIRKKIERERETENAF
jgi:hypothetical protein